MPRYVHQLVSNCVCQLMDSGFTEPYLCEQLLPAAEKKVSLRVMQNTNNELKEANITKII